MNKKIRLKNFKSQSRLNTGIVIILIAAIGTYLVVNGHAATPYVSLNSSSGTVASGSTVQTPCNGSSSGSCVRFCPPIPQDNNVDLELCSPGAPFASTSFWNTPLPDNASINTNSQVYVNQILNQLCYGYNNSSSQNTTPIPNGTTCPASNVSTLNINTYSAPLYVVPANQPYVTVIDSHCEGGTNTYFDNTVLAPGVPVPADAHGSGETVTSGDTDQEIQIYQPSTNKYWDFWKFVKNSSGAWTACFGGVISNVSNSNGIFANNTGAVATSLPLIGGVIRADELQAGQIDHVMNLSLIWNLPSGTLPANVPSDIPTTDIHSYSWPATRNDGFGSGNLAIPEGTRFRLPASFNLSQYNASLVANGKSALTPIAAAIAVAAQKYGFVVDDSAGTVNSRLSDATTFTNTPTPNLTSPYTTGIGVGGVNDNNKGLFNGVGSSNIMANFPWSQLQALRYDYNEPGVPNT